MVTLWWSYGDSRETMAAMPPQRKRYGKELLHADRRLVIRYALGVNLALSVTQVGRALVVGKSGGQGTTWRQNDSLVGTRLTLQIFFESRADTSTNKRLARRKKKAKLNGWLRMSTPSVASEVRIRRNFEQRPVVLQRCSGEVQCSSGSFVRYTVDNL